ncbi:MAG: PEGA domain-containing protein [Planctomycetes bacterium]|nr:PEGA domain-containing protein [Planctomycetota bacterium]
MARTRRRPLAVAALAASASGCTYLTSNDQVLFTSEPPGARIWIDNQDTGRTTPARLPIGGLFGFDHEIRLTKAGYRTAYRRVDQHTEGYTSKWIDGVWDLDMPPLPLFWTFGDMLTPFALRAAIVPGELHVRLYREDEPLLGFERLAAERAAAGTR